MFQFYKIYNLTCHEFHEFYISTEAGRHFWNKIDTHMCSLFLQKQSKLSDENDECYYFFKYTLSKQRYQTYKPKSIFLYGSLRYPKLWRAVSK